MKKSLLGLMVLLFPLTINAQLISVQPGTGRTETKKEAKKAKKEQKDNEPQSSKELQATVEADVVTHYIWRGQDRGGLSIQPTARLSWQGLFFQADGSAGIQKDDEQEINLSLGYQLGGFNIGVTDYWQTGIDSENRYFYYDEQLGAHVLEGNLGFTCKYFSLQGYCMFWGNDYKLDSNKHAYSTYIELGIPFKLAELDWQITAGMTPMESSASWTTKTVDTLLGIRDVKIKNYDYAEGLACITASLRATKDIDLGDVRMPVFAEINTNPYLKKATLLFGLSIIPF